MKRSECETGWGGGVVGNRDRCVVWLHPTPPAAQATLPLKGRGIACAHLQVVAKSEERDSEGSS
jgi:hypothetical protein